MKKILLSLSTIASLALPVAAKEKEIQLAAAPAGVQATVKKTLDAGATLEKIEVEDDGKVYEARIVDKNSVRWAIFMSETGTVTKTEQKKPKKK